ncbi:MAG: prepilin-type N-terminal cleavage/methylation domain-containing protein [bacterium]|nr:prepilin-type N-terminal cleavage/methylation domain-containing protein [bacterium]
MKYEQSQLIQKGWSTTRGFSLVEVILASAVFVLLVTALVGAYLYGQEATALAGSRARATMLAEEGLEAVRNIRDSTFNSLTDGTYGLSVTSNQWIMSGTEDVSGIFTRQITISTVDADRKAVVSAVTWPQNDQRTGSVVLTTRLTNWLSGGGSPPASCSDYALGQGYSGATCRQNTAQCTNHSEIHLSGGDAICASSHPGDSSQDTCCATP